MITYANVISNPDSMKAIRAGLMLKGLSLSAWSVANGVKRQNLCKALSGEWQGPKAKALVEKLLADIDRGKDL